MCGMDKNSRFLVTGRCTLMTLPTGAARYLREDLIFLYILTNINSLIILDIY